LSNISNIVDWSNPPVLENESFTETFTYDALDRPIEQSKPDGSICQYGFNEAGLLETVKVKAAHEGSFTTQVSNINYNEKGQRTDIYYGNNTKTKYEYDTNIFRLTRLLTTRNNGADILQDLNYTYDAVGNITEQADNAQQTHYFNNAVIEAKGKYTYDALYRLLKGSGREKTGSSSSTPGGMSPDMIPTGGQSNSTLSNYCQQFTYDAMGNLLQLSHRSSCGGAEQWKRTCQYHSGMPNNYLLSAYSGATPPSSPDFTYDAHGNMLKMPHLQSMEWDIYDQLQASHKTDESTYYVYSGGERVRKIVLDTSGVSDKIKYERLYLGGYELYREYDTSENLKTERKTLHVLDDKRIIALLEIKTVANGSALPTASQVTKSRYQYTNHLDSASLELNETAAIISYEEYHPFGTTSYSLHTNDTEVTLKRYQYVHKERDEETGLYYYGARYYAPWTCRFISVDPLAADYPYLTPYNYAGNKPITHKDIDGLQGTGDPPVKNEGTNVIGPTPASEEYKKGEQAANKTTENIDLNRIYPDGNIPQAGDKPTDLSHLIGTDFYYEARAIDFELRNPGETAPEYYREYGHKYLHEFKYETRENLSPEGQIWLDKALVNLQYAMEKGLRENPSLESNSDAHRKFAFDTHVDAYEDAGVLSLSVMDKVKITLTPEPQDLLSEEGLKQARQVAADQLEMYQKNPRFAAQQASEAAWGYYSGAIGEEVRKYAEENTGYAIPRTIWKLMLPF